VVGVRHLEEQAVQLEQEEVVESVDDVAEGRCLVGQTA